MKAKLIVDFSHEGCRGCMLKYELDHKYICAVTKDNVDVYVNKSEKASNCPLKISADPEKDIIVLNLSGGTYNLLKRHKINKISQLQKLTKAELLEFRGMGENRYSEIVQAMKEWENGTGENF